MKTRSRFFVGGAVILAVVVWLVASNLQSASTDYLSVSDVLAAGALPRLVRVSGLVVGDTIDWRAEDLVLSFELADDTGRLPVRYRGPQPDMFRDGAQAVVEGKYQSEGVFEASAIFMQCPSKYAEDK